MRLTFASSFQPISFKNGLTTTEIKPARKKMTECAKLMIGACHTKSMFRSLLSLLFLSLSDASFVPSARSEMTIAC